MSQDYLYFVDDFLTDSQAEAAALALHLVHAEPAARMDVQAFVSEPRAEEESNESAFRRA